jgi:hypothetical protein
MCDLDFVMPGLVPGIHVLMERKAWMAGTSPAMTWEGSTKRSMEVAALGHDFRHVTGGKLFQRRLHLRHPHK